MSPTAALRYCSQPGCQARVLRGRCPAHQPSEQDRVNLAVRRWYRTARWKRLRAELFAENPLCATCAAQQRTEVWTDLDHIRPHRGDPRLFWDRANLQGLCKSCHSAKTATRDAPTLTGGR